MQFLDPALDAYCEEHSGAEPEYLRELTAETHEKVHMPQMISSYPQGGFLSLLSHLLKPKAIVEIGTFTGTVRCAWRKGWRKAACWIGSPCTTNPPWRSSPRFPPPFNLVFIDDDKQNYPNYYDAVIGRMRPEGIIIADNVLWSGDVLRPAKEHDEQTRALVEHARRVHTGPRVAPVVILMRGDQMPARIK